MMDFEFANDEFQIYLTVSLSVMAFGHIKLTCDNYTLLLVCVCVCVCTWVCVCFSMNVCVFVCV